ncbi:MAG: hypothetical protein ACRBBW_13105 [Cellvibrionaceae bacterium]
MNIFKRIFAGPETVQTMVKAGIDSGDALFYTSEEKARDKQDVLDWYIKLLDSMAPYNLAMRVLAFVVASVWAVLVMLSGSFYVAGAFVCDVTAQADFIESCRPMLAGNSLSTLLRESVTPYFGLVMTFYFGAAGVNGAIRTYHAERQKNRQ